MKIPKSFVSQAKFFGGALLQGKRKASRPLSKRDTIHFVIRSEWANGSDSFLVSKNYKQIDQIIARFAKRFGIRIYEKAINNNHIHLLLKITNRIYYRAFIKAVTGKIASHIMKQKSFREFSKMKSESKNNRTLSNSFWQFRPFSRIVNWGRDFKTCQNYIKLNVLEAFGFVPYLPRTDYYARYMKIPPE